MSDSKNERITQLLRETDSYLAELGSKVQQQKAAVSSGDTGGSSSAGQQFGGEAVVAQEESAADKYSERSQVCPLARSSDACRHTLPGRLAPLAC